VHNFTRECQSHWRKNFLPHIHYVTTIPCKSLRHKSNTFHTIQALCTCIYWSHLRNQYRWSKQNTAESQTLKIYVRNVHYSGEHMHSNDYVITQSLPQWWCRWWPYLWRDTLLASLSTAWWQCHVHSEWYDFSDVNIMSPGKECTRHTIVVNLPVWLVFICKVVYQKS